LKFLQSLNLLNDWSKTQKEIVIRRWIEGERKWRSVWEEEEECEKGDEW
jgi:hypothetical protein